MSPDTRTMHRRVYVRVEWPAQPGDVIDWWGRGRRTNRVRDVHGQEVSIVPHGGDRARRVPRDRIAAIWRRRTELAEVTT